MLRHDPLFIRKEDSRVGRGNLVQPSFTSHGSEGNDGYVPVSIPGLYYSPTSLLSGTPYNRDNTRRLWWVYPKARGGCPLRRESSSTQPIASP